MPSRRSSRRRESTADTLMDALSDALLSAYKKTPGAAKYARVELDHNTADFRVYELMVPEDLEKKLLDEQFEDQLQAAEAAEAAGEEVPEIEITRSTVDPETGERREPEEPELEPERLEPYRDQIKTRDVTPDDFGRIAAQTAKQVILQRIREAERQMMYEDYKDRVGELVTGIIQQSDNRYTLVQLRERVEALLPRSEQVYNERYDHGMRVKAVITDVSAETKGPSIVVSRRNSRADQEAVRARGPRDRRQAGRDHRGRPRAGLALEDRGDLPRRRGRPGWRLRRPARLAGADGRLRAPRREDRHHPLQRGARPVRCQGALAGPGARGARRRRDQGGDRDRSRRPALAGDRARWPERPSRRPSSPAGRSTSSPRPSSARRRRRSSTRARRPPTAAAPRC